MTVWPDADLDHSRRCNGRTRPVRSTISGSVSAGSPPTERALLERARSGDGEAFGDLYALHHDAVSRLARRLAHDSYEADDVTSEVFCKTLSAIRSGHGPRDDCRPYLLRSVRHTLINRRTRTDTGRAVTVADEQLDSPTVDDLEEGGPATEAFHDVAEQFRDILWYVEVEGHDSVDVAARRRIAQPAASSMLYRARRALRRAYLAGAVNEPLDGEACVPIRQALPAFVDGDVATTSADRVRDHLVDCAACRQALAQMSDVHDRITTRGLMMLLPGALRSLLADGVRTVGTAVGGTSTVLAAATLTIGATAMRGEPPANADAPAALIAPAAPQVIDPRPAPSDTTNPATALTPDDEPVDPRDAATPPPSVPATTPAVPESAPPPAQDTAPEVPGEEATGGEAGVISETVSTVVATVDDVLTPVIATVDSVLQQAATAIGEDGLLGQVAATPVVGDVVQVVEATTDDLGESLGDLDTLGGVTDLIGLGGP